MKTTEILDRLKINGYVTSFNTNQAIIEDAKLGEGELDAPISGGAGENSLINTGELNDAEGKASAAFGSHLETSNIGEVAVGTYNKSNDGTIFSVGVGKLPDNRNNAIEVTTDGDVYVKGMGGYDGTNPDTAITLQEAINGAILDGDVVEIDCGTASDVI